MRAARWHGRRDIRVDEVDAPEPAPHQALVRVLYCGICGTDLEEYRDGPLSVPVGATHPVSGRIAPMTLGHEMVGVVERAADDGSGPAVGTVVIPDVVVGCGTCWWCLRHEDGLCERLNVLGQTDDGGLAEYVAARAATLVVVPDVLDPLTAVLAEPLSVAIRALRKAGNLAGTNAVVLGGGTIGQLIAQLLAAAGARSVVLADPSEPRRRLAAETAPTRAVHPDDLADAVAALPMPGADLVVECTGREGLLADAVRLVRRGGLVLAVGLRAGDEPLPLVDLVLGEKRIVGTAAHVWDTDVAAAVALLANGTVDPAEFLQHVVPLADLVEGGLERLDRADPPIKIIVDCG